MPANPQTAAALWDRNLTVLADFVTMHGRLPKQRETHQLDGVEHRVGKWCSKQRNLTGDRAARFAAVAGTLPVTRTDAWETRRTQVADYYERHGVGPVKGLVVDGAPLGQWVRDQRKAYARGDLTPDRVAALEDIDGWCWSAFADDFDEMATRYETYVARHRTGWVPVRYRDQDGVRLGSWCRWRRRAPHHLTADQQQRLLAAGFTFDTPTLAVRPRVRTDAHVATPAPRTVRSIAALCATGMVHLPFLDTPAT